MLAGSEHVVPPALLSTHDALVSWGPLYVHVSFRIPFHSSIKNNRILDGIILNLYIVFSAICAFIILIPPVHESIHQCLLSTSFSIVIFKMYCKGLSLLWLGLSCVFFGAVLSGIPPL